jgi:uncharacterized membrane protein
MAIQQPFGIRSTAAISGHPLHPLLVTLPVGFLVGVLLTDIAWYATADAFWARASAWLIGAGLVTGALAAIAGFVDFLGSERIRSLTFVWYHFIGNAIALVLAAISLYMRSTGDLAAVTGPQFVLSILVVAILLVTGWLGGELVFRHGVGQTAGSAPLNDEREHRI